MNKLIENLEASIYKGFIDKKHHKNANYASKLLVNNKAKGENVLGSLIEELESCDTFLFSVVFVTEGGLATLETTLAELNKKEIKGRLITSTFLGFNNPKVFRELLKIANLEVRLSDIEGFHIKGYIFEKSDHSSLIVGSSNLTNRALKVNQEWNVKLTSHENGEIHSHFKDQFDQLWSTSKVLSTEWIDEYAKTDTPQVLKREIEKVIAFPVGYSTNSIAEALNIQLNKMQQFA